MKTSDKGIVALATKEGVVVAPYRDSVGVWTWGVGHTAADGFNPKTMSRAMPTNISGVVGEALTLFHEDIIRYENDVNAAVKVPVTQSEFDALVSFHYNTGGIHKAKLTKLLNRGNKVGAGRAFMGWSKPPEIIPRRLAEQILFEDGIYGDTLVSVYGTDGRGNLGRVIDTLVADEILISAPMSTETPKPNWLAALIAAILKLFRRSK